MLRNYIRAQYGPFLTERKYLKSEGFYQNVLTVLRPFVNRQTQMLDVGCGLGRIVFECQSMGANKVVGLDCSKKFIEFCNQLMSNTVKEVHYQVPEMQLTQFMEADIFNMKEVSGRYSLISCVNVFDRVENPQQLIYRLFDLLDIGGILLIACPYDWSLSPATSDLQVADMKSYLPESKWLILSEIYGVPYIIPVDYENDREYSCHFIIAKKI